MPGRGCGETTIPQSWPLLKLVNASLTWSGAGMNPAGPACCKASPIRHYAIARMAARVSRLTRITQNVDDLHERAASQAVLHLHGSLHQPRCSRCGQDHALAAPPAANPTDQTGHAMAASAALPPPCCVCCQGLIRPGVIRFGESLLPATWAAVQAAALDSDVFLSIGSSAVVYAAAALPGAAQSHGVKVVQINPQPTPLDAEVQNRTDQIARSH